MADVLQIVGSPHLQTSVEQIAYILDITNGPSSGNPSSISVTAVNIADNSDVTTTLFPTNSPTSTGNLITLSPCRNTTAGGTYHIRVQYTRAGNVFQPYAIIHCPY